ncbi:MAG: flagellar protein FliS [Planctomycetaceae bacterium]|nr:flagellar protein FliS [Planctomycetaceae bacterium]
MAGADAYLKTQVRTASPYRLHLMVVEGAIRYARLGAESLESQDYETAHLSLGQSRDFVTELIGGLRDEYDSELAKRMKQLFFFAYINLAEGERDRDLPKVKDALKILQMHHETWLELGAKLQPPPPKGKSQGSPTPPKEGNQPRAWSA